MNEDNYHWILGAYGPMRVLRTEAINLGAVWPQGKGTLGGRCPECGDQVMLHWKDKVSAEYYCMGCGLILKHAGYQKLDNAELRKIILEVFNELEAKGIKEVKLQAFLRVCDALSQALYDRPIRSLELRDLEAMGLETYCGLVKRRKVQSYCVSESSKGRK